MLRLYSPRIGGTLSANLLHGFYVGGDRLCLLVVNALHCSIVRRFLIGRTLRQHGYDLILAERSAFKGRHLARVSGSIGFMAHRTFALVQGGTILGRPGGRGEN